MMLPQTSQAGASACMFAALLAERVGDDGQAEVGAAGGAGRDFGGLDVGAVGVVQSASA